MLGYQCRGRCSGCWVISAEDGAQDAGLSVRRTLLRMLGYQCGGRCSGCWVISINDAPGPFALRFPRRYNCAGNGELNAKTVYLGLGSNVGDKKSNMRAAVKRLRDAGSCDVTAVSSLYRTAPVDVTDQPDFLNAVIAARTTLRPSDLLKLCRDVEHSIGRKRTIRWGPRVIDIDILLYEDQILRGKDLAIPHPRITERAFVLVPLAEIAPDVVLRRGLTAQEAARAIDCGGVERIEPASWSD